VILCVLPVDVNSKEVVDEFKTHGIKYLPYGLP